MRGPLLLWALAGCEPGSTGSVEVDLPGSAVEDLGASSVAEAPSETVVDPRTITSVPVYGGTLESLPDLDGFVAADPEGDRLVVRRGSVFAFDGIGDLENVDLGPNARPFRLLVEGTQIYVTLRGTGELVAVDLTGFAQIVWRTHVCSEPRGVARSPAGPLVVACAEGLVVEVSDEGSVLRSTFAIEDLRDIVPVGDLLYVSRFASAEVVGVDPVTLDVVFRVPTFEFGRVAWRMREDTEDGGVLVLHQMTSPKVVKVPATGFGHAYYNSCQFKTQCGCLNEPMVTRIPAVPSGDVVVPPTAEPGSSLEDSVLTTDFVVAPDGTIAFANAGAEVGEADITRFDHQRELFGKRKCTKGARLDLWTEGRGSSVAFDAEGELLLQGASPLGLFRTSDGANLVTTVLRDETDDAVSLFHQATAAQVACASCHPEGLDDGVVWQFLSKDKPGHDPVLDLRRTMSLAGEILARQPYHWAADLADPEALMLDTFTERMGGSELGPNLTASLFNWLDGLRPVRTTDVDSPETVAAGQAAFVEAGCDTCHGGPAYTYSTVETVRVGVEPVKTPSLHGVGTRQPLFHDGCAATLEDRFLPPCDDGLDLHGTLSVLDDAEIAALIAFLRTL